MCEQLCFLFKILWLPPAMSVVFSCREDEIVVQIISNIRLVLLFWLTCTHTYTLGWAVFWHLSTAKQYVDQRREHRSCERSFENRAGFSRGIHTHTHKRFQCMEGYLKSISLCTVSYIYIYIYELQKNHLTMR